MTDVGVYWMVPAYPPKLNTGPPANWLVTAPPVTIVIESVGWAE
jgi:hypothetical protein